MATALSLTYGARVCRGEPVPHPMHWKSLAAIGNVQPIPLCRNGGALRKPATREEGERSRYRSAEMSTRDAVRLRDARAALEQSDWPAAFDAFVAADRVDPLEVDDLERAAVSGMWVGELDACVALRQRAFALCMRDGDTRRSAGLAIDLCMDHARAERMAVALGWMQHAERLLADAEVCAEV